ncbi:xanthine dehydrogenase small subunit [Halomonas sp. PAMB 3264]|uniref:xanthine dehydrogenase small subunit n=1 Tax=Halomonas sp. PAMB 3264 TaxID=3075222 RepID=UPI00289C60C1|nr:xanthine dehydrogenase small subunit [Halomonas sp. PAMB 3264]WNL40814.1 xanthine dehydrogenase small subunit [Halomonas sp. PAMB 3264]
MASVEFLLNGVLKRCNVAPDTSALNLLRDTLGYTGTKEGCASGDCGACTVALRDANAPNADFASVNACITPAHQLQDKLLVTVEGLETAKGLHPAQQTMIEGHASQCGFCTPGIVMSLFTLYQGNALKAPFSHRVLEEALGGNLCRCTGYRPIRDAALQMQTMRWQSPVWLDAASSAAQSMPSNDPPGDALFFKSPTSLDALLTLRARHPNARLVAGATDLWLENTQQLKALNQLIDVTRVDELRHIEASDDPSRPGWWIGAAVTYTELETLFERHFPAFAHLLSRLGSRQIRNRGTLGGNIANASPIGDTPPVLLALGAWLEIAGPSGARSLPLESFFIDYKKTALQSDEVVSRIFIPALTEHATLRVWKLSKRREDDISAVLGAFHYAIDDGVLSQVRLGFGGMAAISKRALHAEAALEGQPVTQASFQAAQRALAKDFEPMSDVRGSSHYREQAAANLLERLYLTLTMPTQEVMIHAYAH